jgi:hypothetical protein
MATILLDNVTIGVPPLVPPARQLPLIPVGNFEFKPARSPLDTAALLQSGEISDASDYIAPYQAFSLTVEGIPNFPAEVVQSVQVTIDSCVLEEPLPGADITRSGNTEFEIPASPYWISPLFLEPLVTISPTGPFCTISGYFTERNFYDQEWILQYENAIARFTSEGITFTDDKKTFGNFVLSSLSGTLSSGINVNTFYPISIPNAYTFGPEIMQGYINLAERVISYKPSEIKKLRFYFSITVTSNLGVYPYTAHMTVQNNQKAAQSRLEYALNRRTFGGLLPGI